jgi:type VI secretion system protein ImpE
MVRTYQEVLRCEILRRGVFAGDRTPLMLGDPEPWMAQLVEALRISAQGDPGASQRLRDQAFDLAPVTAGTMTYADQSVGEEARSEVPFEWLADADSRLGPLLEVIMNGRYYWVPFQRIKAIDITAPEDLRDLVWLPAKFQWANLGQAVGMIPTRYPGSETSQDSQLRLARRTEWHEVAAGVYAGVGQRVFATDQSEYALMNVRRIEIAQPVV